ncbi:MAG: class I SAM-dependent methyltransferase [Candidatus Saccharimonadales bacterium]
MRQQQHVWELEHSNGHTLPTMANTEPASGVVLFLEFLYKNNCSVGKAVDIGSGKGRNAVYMAKEGFEVVGLEYIAFARKCAEQLAVINNVSKKVKFLNANIDEPWQFGDACFDIAIDSFSSIDIETKHGREVYRDEMYRTLKPGGYALVTVCSADDEWESERIAHHPGPEPNSTIWPENGKFQKNYTESELKDFYSIFTVCELRIIKKPAYKLGREGTATNFWVVLQK